MISSLISCILVAYIIVRPGNLFLKINTALFFLVCWFLTKKILIQRKIFSLMLINMCALYLMPGTDYQQPVIITSIISLSLAGILFYRILDMASDKDLIKACFSCVFYVIFGLINLILINYTQIYYLSILAIINFALLAYLCTNNLKEQSTKKEPL